MAILAGTSGYSYKEWKGRFYPEKTPASGMLSFYAAKLPAVEINNTFYRMPKAAVLENWCDQVPEHFRFVLKASRRITHFKRLKDAADETRYVVETSEVLGERRGALLFQLPPNMKCDLDRLRCFLDDLPAGVPCAFEFRHPSWLDDDGTLAALREREAALCLSDDEDAPLEELVATAPFGYLRLRRPGYDDGALRRWLADLRSAGLADAFVFFKHEDAGGGPALATRFLELERQTRTARARPRAAATRRTRETG